MRIKDMSSKEWNKKIIREEIIKSMEDSMGKIEFGEYEISVEAEKIITNAIEELKFLIGDTLEG